MKDYSGLKISPEVFEKLPERLKYNKVISEYYESLFEEYKKEGLIDDKYLRIADRVKGCSTLWQVLLFKSLGLKSIEDFNRCKDKFCVNCQNALAQNRYRQFSPIFLKLGETQKVFHCIFTVKNCSGELLRSTVKGMYKAFSYLIRYLDGRCNIKDFDFSYLGFSAGVKALEVTYNREENTYHPHLHCLMAFSKDLQLDKKTENVFSRSRLHPGDVILFSSEELLFQKIWYLLNCGIKVTNEHIGQVEDGYSVVFNEANPKDFKEVFKYAFKNDLDKDRCLDYERFKIYRQSLKNVRFVQGYGLLRNVDFEDDSLDGFDIDIAYHDFMADLFDTEEPEIIYEKSLEVLQSLKSGGIYITRGSIKSYLTTTDENTENVADVLQKY